jgi:4-hydroxy-tetrahydrodipicolinate synthase
MKSGRLQGVFTALVTPFAADGSLDEAGLRRVARYQIAGGVAGLVPVGTTGEAVTLTTEEHVRVVEIAVEEAKKAGGDVKVIAGAGSNDTRKTAALAKKCAAVGADAVLIVTPYYNKPKQDGLVAHFRAVADAAGVPVVLYNVPGRTACNMTPDTVLTLAEDPRFVAVKEASGNLIAVVSNEAPAHLVRLVAAALAGERAEAARLHAELHPLMKANFLESSPIPVKWAVARLGLCEGHLRLPLTPLSPSLHGKMEAILGELGLLGGAAAEKVPAAARA